MEEKEKVNLSTSDQWKGLPLVEAGFPSPAENYREKRLDPGELLVKRPAATFFLRVRGSSMKEAGIQDGDILVVDRSLEVASGQVVVALFEGEMVVKRLEKRGGRTWLKSEAPPYQSVEITGERDFSLWGVVLWSLHYLGDKS